MENQPTTNQQHENEPQRYKTLGVRLDEDLHARLSFIAQLSGSTITDEIRRSIDARIETAMADPELIARAEEVRAEIEREAQARQQAISGFFGAVAVEVSGPRPSRRGGKPAGSPETS
jgi:hypothetical protein